MNNNIILDTKNNSIIAICKDATTAHPMAETYSYIHNYYGTKNRAYSYIHNKSAWYSLFDIRLATFEDVDRDVINQFIDGRW